MSFNSWRSYQIFKHAVSANQRYFLDEESKSFLNSIMETCKGREITLQKGGIVWRAQNGHEWTPIYQTDPITGESIYVDDCPCPFPSERMKPLKDSATEGRANSKGIPHLYVASDKETAMSEIRPWLGAILTVAKLKLKKDLKILDFSVSHGQRSFNLNLLSGKASPKEIDSAVWSDIDNAFSQPIKASDIKQEYAPTQIISEFVRLQGFDGIAYKSSLGEGYNICLFELNVADVINCSIFEPISIKFDFKKVD